MVPSVDGAQRAARSARALGGKEDMSMSGSKSTKNAKADLATALIAGIKKNLSTVPQLTVGGQNLTPAQVEAQLLAFATLRSDVNAAKTAWETKLADERSKGPALQEFLAAVVSFVRGTFGNSPETLAEFGLKPKKAAKTLTAEEQAAKAVKAKATRTARGTKGKKEKLAVQGDVTGIIVVPVTDKPNPQPAPVTAAAASSAPNGAAK
jgi:hypothetical protein